MKDATEQFRGAIERAGLSPPSEIIADGEIHRFASNGDRNDDAGWYVFFADEIPAGEFGCWRKNLKLNWISKADSTLTAAQRERQQVRFAEAKRQRQEKEAERRAEAAEFAQTLWSIAEPAPADHPYLKRKGVQSHGLKIDSDNNLILSVTVEGMITSIQFIPPIDGQNKKFLFGGAIKGGTYILGTSTETGPILIAEGFATAASLFEATGFPVAIAFFAGNLRPAAQALRQQFPSALIIVCADNDIKPDTLNVGLEAATTAAEAIQGIVAVPELDGMKCDFNDVHVARGLEAVREAIAAVLIQSENILDEVHRFLGRFVSYPSSHAQVAHTLWVAHTHLMDMWESTPRLAFLSPEAGSGKTRALELTETLVPRPVEAVNVTSAYLFRKIADPDGLPTVLHDEIDTVFGPRATEHEEIRGVINAGHRRGASAGRCVVVGKLIKTEELSAYCAVALAGLGNLPDTILSRSIIIRMQRKAPDEVVESYRRKVHAPEGYQLRAKLAQWATQIRPSINLYPAMPEGITDRNADVWEALLSIADAAGGTWPERARVAGVALVALTIGRTPSLGLQLLKDIKAVFDESQQLTTESLITSLLIIEESPWADLRGKPLDPRKLAGLLRPYGIQSKNLRIGSGVFRGYDRSDFYDVWLRYLPDPAPVGLPPIVSATSTTPSTLPLSIDGDGASDMTTGSATEDAR